MDNTSYVAYARGFAYSHLTDLGDLPSPELVVAFAIGQADRELANAYARTGCNVRTFKSKQTLSTLLAELFKE